MEKHTYDLLKDLSELLTDSQRGYAEAADRVDSPEVKAILLKLGNGRAPLIAQIDAEMAVDSNGPPQGGTVKGTLHRAWIDIREALARSSEHAVLDECERGEEYLLQRYATVLADDRVPLHVKTVLRTHPAAIQADLDRVKAMKQASRSA